MMNAYTFLIVIFICCCKGTNKWEKCKINYDFFVFSNEFANFAVIGYDYGKK